MATALAAGTIPVTAGSSTLDLAHPTQLRVSLGLGTVTVTVVHGGRDVYSGTIEQGKTLDYKFAHPFIRGDLDLTANFETGEIAGSGSIEARIPFTGHWHDLLRIDPAHPKVLATYDPCSGVVGDQSKLQDAAKPNMDGNARFGPCALATPNVLRIHVTDHGRVVNNIGQMVKRRLFKDTPEFVFNTVASVGGTDSPAYARHYTDPESPWFNLFLGYYQIDAAESAGWTRPFGFRSDDAEASEPKFEELVQLGMADWNWFSNWNYGTPVDAIEAAEALDKGTPWIRRAAAFYADRQDMVAARDDQGLHRREQLRVGLPRCRTALPEQCAVGRMALLLRASVPAGGPPAELRAHGAGCGAPDGVPQGRRDFPHLHVRRDGPAERVTGPARRPGGGDQPGVREVLSGARLRQAANRSGRRHSPSTSRCRTCPGSCPG